MIHKLTLKLSADIINTHLKERFDNYINEKKQIYQVLILILNKFIFLSQNVYEIFTTTNICVYNKHMSSYSTKYRREHPEYYEKEKSNDRERIKNKYHNNPEYREKVKQQALARFYRLKEPKMNTSISV
jgi:hypothetical protein